jgi:mannose-6-phosphate isomerase
MERLDNRIQPYAWGSRTSIAELRGRDTPSDTPEAELWMGAHPLAPSRSTRDGRTLIERIAAAPEAELGAETLAAFGPRLPFLLKVLAAEQPLSLQAHPSIAQAEEGFDREERASVPRDAPHRNYRDRNHKPELICALSPFVALCGFRELEGTRALLDRLAVPALAQLSQRLGDLRSAFAWLMTLAPAERQALVSDTIAACTRVAAAGGAFADECSWGARIGAIYAGDAGVIGALLLNLVHLAPGEAIYLPAGNLHAYLHGVGVEVMASSDNVLRGGLTPKHVDVPELLRVLDFRAGAVEKVLPMREGSVDVWKTPAREFELSRVRGTDAPITLPVHAPIIAICTSGTVALTDEHGTETLGRGDSVFVAGSTRSLTARGDGEVYLATCGQLTQT